MDVEVIDPVNRNEKDFPVLVSLKEAQVPVQTVIVNGQQQEIMGTVCVLVCPKCGNVIQRFQPGIPFIEILKSLNTDDEEQLKSTLYCITCGQKLKFMRPSFVDNVVESSDIVEEHKE